MKRDSWPIEVDRIWGCFVWQGALSDAGRPIVWRGQRPSSAYRIAYEEAFGPIPDDKVCDHLCKNKLCVAPHHLEATTKSENERRKQFKHLVKRTRCPRGHDMSFDAVVTPFGGRVCRTCNREAVPR